MPPFSSDIFRGNTGTDLNANPMSGGGTWARTTYRSVDDAVVTAFHSARFGGAAFEIPVYYASETPPTANQRVTGEFWCRSNVLDSLTSLATRLSTSADTFYYLRNYYESGGAGTWHLVRRVAGADTTVAAYPQTLTPGQRYRVTFESVGDNHAAWVDGRCVLGGTDASITAANRVGLAFYSASTWTDSTGTHVSNWVAENLGDPQRVIGFVGDSHGTTYLTANEVPVIAGSVVRDRTGLTTRVVNRAVNSTHTGTGANGWGPGAASNYLAAAKTAFSAAGVVYVGVLLGANDANDANAFSASTFGTNLDAICDDLVGSGFKPILHYPTWFDTAVSAGEGFGAAALARVESYMAQIDALVDGANVLRGDTRLYEYLRNNPSQLHTDGYHLSVTGKMTAGQYHGEATARAVFSGGGVGSGPMVWPVRPNPFCPGMPR